MATMEDRIAQLEKSNRWQRALLAVAGAGLLVVLCGGGAPPKEDPPSIRYGEIRATRFSLVDSKGKERGSMALIADTPFVALYRASGTPGILLSADDRGGVVSIKDAWNTSLVDIGAIEHGGAVQLFDRKHHKPVTILSVNEQHSGRCEVSTPKGDGLAILESRRNMGLLATFGPDGKPTGLFP